MDMKRILQAMDGVATKPVAGANDMAKFLSVVDKNSTEVLTEGSNPHKVSLPVQMAMQHYQQPQQETNVKSPIRTSIRKFFHDVEQEVAEEKTNRQQLLRQYSQVIAERVLMKENSERKQGDIGVNSNELDVRAHRFLQKAHQKSPGASDLEAIAVYASELADTARDQQDTIEQQQAREQDLVNMYSNLQDVQRSTEERFRKLNAQVANDEITQQDAAQAAQEIEADHDTQIHQLQKHNHGKVDQQKLSQVTPEPVKRTNQQVDQRAQPIKTKKHAVASTPRHQPATTAPAANPFASLVNPPSTVKTAKPTSHINIGSVPDPAKPLATPPDLFNPQPSLPGMNPFSATDYINKLRAQRSPAQAQHAPAIHEDVAATLAPKIIKAGQNVFDDLMHAFLERHPKVTIQYPTGDTVTIARNKINDLFMHHYHAPAELKKDIEHEILNDPRQLAGFLKHPPPAPQQNLPLQSELPFPPPAAGTPPVSEHYATSDLSRAKVMSTGPGLQQDPGEGHLSLEDSTSTMHPTKRYRMMRRISKRSGIGLSDLELATDEELHQLYKQHGLTEAPIAMDPAEPNNPLIHSHQKANPATLKDRIMRTRAQLKELAEMAQTDDLVTWEHICSLAKGGMFMGLEQNLEQIRHGIHELAQARKTGVGAGGSAVRGQINKHIGESEMKPMAPAKPAKPKVSAVAPAKPQKVKTIKAKNKTSPCRTGQVQTGVQNKNGKIVPKCSVR
jgi:ribosomal protein S20